MNLFKEDSLTTVGVGFGHKTVEIDNKIIKTQIWDTGTNYYIWTLTNPFWDYSRARSI